MNNVRDRAYNVEINNWGDKSRDSRSDCGKAAKSGADENTVVSRVMRRMSHFLRCASRGSCEGMGGGRRNSNAEFNKVNVTATSR